MQLLLLLNSFINQELTNYFTLKWANSINRAIDEDAGSIFDKSSFFAIAYGCSSLITLKNYDNYRISD